METLLVPGKTAAGLLAALMLASLALHVWGIRRDLPFQQEIDEPIVVVPAVRTARSGNWNPGWFGHPGSTSFYPLALFYRLADGWLPGFAASPDGSPAHDTFETHAEHYYYAGRWLAIAYSVGALPALFLIGSRVFSPWTGLLAVGLFLLYPLPVEYAQMVRSDSAALFFSLWALWFCLLVFERPSWKYHLAAGLGIGLAIASRYFMAALIPAYLAAALRPWWDPDLKKTTQRNGAGLAVAGLGAILAGFTLSTPYFFLDFTRAWNNLLLETRSTHLGADGLTPLGNLFWYLFQALPKSVSWPQVFFAAAGLGWAVFHRNPRAIPLLLFPLALLAGISLSPLHWARWLIQALPILALFAAFAVTRVAEAIPSRSGSAGRRLPAAALALALAITPASALIRQNQAAARFSTEVAARHWIEDHLPHASRVAYEWYSAPLHGVPVVSCRVNHLAMDGRTLDYYLREGFDYLVVSGKLHERFKQSPNHAYALAFYEDLSQRGKLLQRIEPTPDHPGHWVEVWEVPNSSNPQNELQ